MINNDFNDQYEQLKNLQYKIVEMHNPINKDDVDVILYTEFLVGNGSDYITVEGVEISDFLRKNAGFATDKNATLEKLLSHLNNSTSIRYRYSNNFIFRMVS